MKVENITGNKTTVPESVEGDGIQNTDPENRIRKYSESLNNVGWNCAGPLIHDLFQ